MNWKAIVSRGCLIIGLAEPMAAGCVETFRWHDDEGVTNYSDKVPPEQAKQRRSRLNQQGMEVEVIEPPKSAAQLRQEQQLRQLRSQQEKILAVQRDQDRALLRTYRSLEEMNAALQGKLDTLEASARITESNRLRQKDILATQEKRAADLERQGQPVPQNLRDLMFATRRQIAAYDEKLRGIQAEKNTISAQFRKDMTRFQALMAAQSTQPGSGFSISSGRVGGRDDLIISAVSCAQGPSCERAWTLARDYVTRNSPAGLSVDTDRVIQTPSPVDDHGFAITVTRIANRSEEILFLDVRCRPSSIGEELCASSRVSSLRADFKSFVEAGLGTLSGSRQ
jgi:hypothetical protein